MVLTAIIGVVLGVAVYRTVRGPTEYAVTVTARAWRRTITFITPIARGVRTTGEEVIVWKGAPHNTNTAERWQVSRVEDATGADLPLFWPEAVPRANEREHGRSEEFTAEVKGFWLGRMTLGVSEADFSRYTLGRQLVLSRDGKGLLRENPTDASSAR